MEIIVAAEASFTINIGLLEDIVLLYSRLCLGLDFLGFLLS